MATADLVVVVPGSGCMQCLGKDSTNVWCSRTYSYLITTATTPLYQYEQTTGAKAMQAQIPAADGADSKGDYDGGACCDTNANFQTYTGAVAAAAAPTTVWKYTAAQSKVSGGVAGTAAGCPAIKNTAFTTTGTGGAATTDFGQGALDDATVAWSSWWCSNGLYKTVTSGTAGLLNGTQLFLSGSNQRRELARVGCPQKAAFCGKTAAADIKDIFTAGLTSTAVVIEVATTSDFTYNEKCTWAAGSYAWAPTFAFSTGATSGAPGITTPNW
jgi:hypothetical protein